MNAEPRRKARRYRSYELWNQFVRDNRGRHIDQADFDRFTQVVQAKTKTNGRAENHPNFVTHIRPLVTYKSKNVNTKDCAYGTYRDGNVVKCLRNPNHHKLNRLTDAGLKKKRDRRIGAPPAAMRYAAVQAAPIIVPPVRIPSYAQPTIASRAKRDVRPIQKYVPEDFTKAKAKKKRSK